MTLAFAAFGIITTAAVITPGSQGVFDECCVSHKHC
jgi:hypothetical protein